MTKGPYPMGMTKREFMLYTEMLGSKFPIVLKRNKAGRVSRPWLAAFGKLVAAGLAQANGDRHWQLTRTGRVAWKSDPDLSRWWRGRGFA